MSTPVDVPAYDIQLYEGITFFLQFQIQSVDENGTVTGDYPLTGKELHVFLDDATRDDLHLVSSNAPNENGSYVAVTDSEAGVFEFKFGADDLAPAQHGTNSRWRVEAWSGGNKELLLYGAAPIRIGGLNYVG